ncbi:hypothetical protein Dsin_011693 [Dipteronia sinensis]|uniref:DUF4283 domain-containing protein n=1 Tax=Dipteronia sinensis TaxID=43782 RepID=A0AAE0AGL6_9ROSI|nr:hypothetical protein Dsin_011693 [Dipteronia sinensis]
MNADEIANLCKTLFLKEREGPLMPLQKDLANDGQRRISLRLVGKFLANKLVNRDAFMNPIPKIWRTMEGFEIEVVSGNIFSFTFKNTDDRRVVLQGGPWTFDKSLLVLEEPTDRGKISGMKFNKTTFWVQIHNVSLLCMTRDIGLFLGSLIGDDKDFNGMEVDAASLHIGLSNKTGAVGDPMVLNSTMDGSTLSPKVGKWKRWARDRSKLNDGLGLET